MQTRVEEIARRLDAFAHVDASRIVCFRSRGSTARIYARIWGLDRIWQMALGVEAHYAIEVVEHFDRSCSRDQDETLIHELMHVPKTFSGALVPHRCFGKRIDCRSVGVLYQELIASRAAEAVRARVAARPADPSPGEPTEGGLAASRPEAPLDRWTRDAGIG